MWAFDGEELQLLIDYKVDGEFVIPTSAQALVRDRTGAAVGVPLILPVDTTSASLTVDGASNVLAPDSTSEYRYVTVTFFHDGRQHRMDLSYQVMPFAPVTAGPEDVRRELGLDASELPDADIDIRYAYLLLQKDYGPPFTEALSAGDYKAPLAQRAVAIRAAIDICHSLPFRAGIKFSSEENQFQRQGDFDPQTIRRDLGQILSGLIEEITGEALGGTPTLVLATPVDVVTGV